MNGPASRRIFILLVWGDYHGCTNRGLLVAQAPHICASLLYSLRHVTVLVPRILRLLQDFWQISAP